MEEAMKGVVMAQRPPQYVQQLSAKERAADPGMFRTIGIDTDSGTSVANLNRSFRTVTAAQDFARDRSSSAYQVSVFDDKGKRQDRKSSKLIT